MSTHLRRSPTTTSSRTLETEGPSRPASVAMQAVLDQLAGLNGKPIEHLTAREARLQPSPAADAVKKGVLTVKEALTYVMSLPVATLVSGMNSLAVLRQNLEIAATFTPMTLEAMQALRDRCALRAADGRFELYKTSKKFDGTPGREYHGFPPLTDLAE